MTESQPQKTLERRIEILEQDVQALSEHLDASLSDMRKRLGALGTELDAGLKQTEGALRGYVENEIAHIKRELDRVGDLLRRG